MSCRQGCWVVVGVVLFGGCAWFRSRPIEPRIGATQVGVASWYGPGFHGNPTASGEVYDQYELTAAHPTLPLGTRVLVTNLENGRQVEVRINDRGPFAKGRVIDLSYAAGRSLGMTGTGTARVRLEVLGFDAPGRLDGAYTIQLGSFVARRDAERLRRALIGRFSTAYVQAWRANGATYYRVRVGRFRHHQEAVQHARQLGRLGLTPIVIATEEAR
jgi:rare lipoprotein A